MALAAGAKLGPYEIVAPIGAGGMGEVYRARDTRLGREVAIKVSAERFSERFEKEAHAIASLNHPNICTLHDVGPNYLVMELVEGPTLADRTANGKIPLAETLGIARQIVDALEAAHEKGIVHRDLKPANIKIKPDGTVKVLDFGLAKTADPGGPGSNPDNSPTLTLQDATRVGVILGTAGYMSPEQASGKSVDKRADIWSFGVVLWEMLTGKRMFAGETVSHTLAAVLIQEPNWSQLPEGTPQSLRRLLRRCLERDLKRRLADIGTARLELEEAAAGAGGEAAAPSAAPSPSPVRWMIAAVALALIAAVAGVGWWRAARPVAHPLARLEVDLGADVSLPSLAERGGVLTVVLSPDGTRVAYVSGTPPRLFARRLDQPNSTELPGTQGASQPFFSPDGQWIGFVVGTKLNKISVEGGAVVTLAEMPLVAGAAWGPDGNIVAGGAITYGLTRLPAGGGTPAPLLKLAKGEFAQTQPQILPGGKAVLFASVGASLNPDQASIDVLTLADGRRKTLVRGGISPFYLPSGHLIYLNKSNLFAISFDLDRLETRGNAVRVLDDVGFEANTRAPAALAFSSAGTLIYRRDGGNATATMTTVEWLDTAGKRQPLLARPGAYSDLSLSPDGKRLALLVNGADPGIVVYDPQRDTTTRLASERGQYSTPVWAPPDGRYLVFSIFNVGTFWTRSDGAGQPQLMTQTEVPRSFSRDGKHLASVALQPPGITQLWTAPVEELGGQWTAGKAEPFLKSQSQDSHPVFSPDGRWLAYQSNSSGKDEVYVRAFPPPASGQGGFSQISNNGGTNPVWSQASHDLLYQASNQIMSVTYSVEGDTFKTDKPRVWLDKFNGMQFDLAPDGKRIAALIPATDSAAPAREHTVVFLENFFDYLRQRVPVEK